MRFALTTPTPCSGWVGVGITVGDDIIISSLGPSVQANTSLYLRKVSLGVSQWSRWGQAPPHHYWRVWR